MYKLASHHHSVGQDLFHELVTEGIEKQAGFSGKATRNVMGKIYSAVGRGEKVGKKEVEGMIEKILSEGLKGKKPDPSRIPELKENILRRVKTVTQNKTGFTLRHPLDDVTESLRSVPWHERPPRQPKLLKNHLKDMVREDGIRVGNARRLIERRKRPFEGVSINEIKSEVERIYGPQTNLALASAEAKGVNRKAKITPQQHVEKMKEKIKKYKALNERTQNYLAKINNKTAY